MESFGPWNVVDDPARGEALLILSVTPTDGLPIAEGHSDHEVPILAPRTITFKIKAHPWHRTGVRPFACDVYRKPLHRENRAEGAVGENEQHSATIVIAIARDVKLDESDYWDFVARRPKNINATTNLDHLVIRVMDAGILPDLGDPILAKSLLPTSRWSVNDAMVNDLELLKEANESTPADLARFRALPLESRLETVTINRLPQGMEFASSLGRWSVTLSYPGNERTGIVWELASPIRTMSNQYELRLVVTSKVKVVYLTFSKELPRDPGGHQVTDPRQLLNYDPMRVRIGWETEVGLLPRAGSFLHNRELQDKHPDDRKFLHDPIAEVGFQISKAVIESFQTDPTAQSLALIAPLSLVPGPVGAVATIASFFLSIGSVYAALTERSNIVSFGVDHNGVPRSRADVEDTLNFAVFGLLVDAASVVGLASKAGRATLHTLAKVRRFDVKAIEEMVRSAPVPLQLALRQLKGPLMARLLSAAVESTDAAAFLKVYRRVLHVRGQRVVSTFLLDGLEFQRILTPNYLHFRHPELRELYESYVASRQRRIASSGLSSTEIRRLIKEPLDWLLSGNDRSQKTEIMAQWFGNEWRALIKRFRPYVPLREEMDWVRELNRPMDYAKAKIRRKNLTPDSWRKIIDSGAVQHRMEKEFADLIRAAEKKTFGKQWQFDHPLEGRCVKSIAAQFGIKHQELLSYEHAEVLLVPRNRMVASRLPDFESIELSAVDSGGEAVRRRPASEILPHSVYDHVSKSLGTETLIPYGKEHLYSLQEIRDAHVFVIHRLAGHDSPAIKMIDDAISKIAQHSKIRQEVKVDFIPDYNQFKPDSWKYFPPSPELKHAMKMEQYVRQRFLIDLAIDD